MNDEPLQVGAGCVHSSITIDRATGDEVCEDCGAVNGKPPKPCDHKFIDSKRCLKCGWSPDV